MVGRTPRRLAPGLCPMKRSRTLSHVFTYATQAVHTLLRSGSLKKEMVYKSIAANPNVSNMILSPSPRSARRAPPPPHT